MPPPHPGQPGSATASALSADALFRLAVEIWRLNHRIQRSEPANPCLRDASERVRAALAACGIEIRDPEGESYHPGMAMDVLTSDGSGAVVQETVRPAIYFGGHLTLMAQVILGSAKEAHDDEEHD